MEYGQEFTRFDTLEALEKRRAAWAAEADKGTTWLAPAAPRIIAQLDAEIARRKATP